MANVTNMESLYQYGKNEVCLLTKFLFSNHTPSLRNYCKLVYFTCTCDFKYLSYLNIVNIRLVGGL